MKYLTLFSLLFSISCMAVNPTAPDVIVHNNIAVATWEPCTARDNGDDLLLEEIAYYEMLFGRADDDGDATVLNVGRSNVWISPELTSGEWQFWMRCVDTGGIQGLLSNEMRVTVEVLRSRPGPTSASAKLQ